MKALTDKESRIVRAIGQTFFPRDGELEVDGIDAGVVEFVDRYLARLTRWERLKVKALLRAFDVAPALGNLDGRRTFSLSSHAERVEYLEGWETSTVHLRRKAYEGLRALMVMAFVSSGAVAEKLGIDNLDIEELDPVEEMRQLADLAGRGVAE